MQLQILMLEAELLAEMLLAVVEAGFFPKVQCGHRSISCHERPWPTGKEALMAGQLPSAQPILPQEGCKDSVLATQQRSFSPSSLLCIQPSVPPSRTSSVLGLTLLSRSPQLS